MDEEKPWFHGPLSRQQVEDLLQNKKLGSYLVRSSTRRPGDYVLCVREKETIKHYIIEKKSDKEYEIGSQTFPDLVAVINFYKYQLLDTTTLTSAVETQSEKTMDEVGQDDDNNVIEQAIAKFDFPGADEEDLPFVKNEILDIISKQEANWWTARNSKGIIGAVPVTYLNPINAEPPEDEQPPSNNNDESLIEFTGGDTESVPIFAKAICDRAKNPFDPTALSYKSGDIIKVVEKADSGLWTGELKGQNGTFPFTHVVVLNNNECSEGSRETWEAFTE